MRRQLHEAFRLLAKDGLAVLVVEDLLFRLDSFNFVKKHLLDMSTIALKDILVSRIAEIDDIQFLKAIKTILDTKTESQTLELTSAQIQEIETSREDIAAGRFVEQSDLDSEIAAWLKGR